MARSAMQNRRTLDETRRQLEQKFCRVPTDVEMATALDMPIETYRNIVLASQPVRDEPIDDAYSDHLMLFADPSCLQDEALSRAQIAALLKGAIDQLTEREQVILQLYFVEDLNLDEIGLVLGVGAARVCQIKKTALSKMRALIGPVYA